MSISESVQGHRVRTWNRLSLEHRRVLEQAVGLAAESYEDVRRVARIFELDLNLDDVCSPDSTRLELIHGLIGWVQQNDRLDEFLDKLIEHYGNNNLICEAVERVREHVVVIEAAFGDDDCEDFDYHFFVSYSDQDAKWCLEELLEPLHDVDVRVVHRANFGPDFGLAHKEWAVERSYRTVLIMTPGWVESQWDDYGKLLNESADQESFLRRLVVLRVRDTAAPDRLAGVISLDFTSPDQRQRTFKSLLELLDWPYQDVTTAVSRIAARGFTALSILMQIPAVQEAASRFEDSFSEAVCQIQTINSLKKLHDYLQRADDTFKLLIRERRRCTLAQNGGPGSEVGTISDELESTIMVLDTQLGMLLERAADSGFSDDQIPWVGLVKLIRSGLKIALDLDSRDVKSLELPVEQLQRLMGSEPLRIDDRIIMEAKRLSLEKVAGELQQIRDTVISGHKIDAPHQARLDDFSRGVLQTRQFARELAILVKNHSWLQQVDNALRPIEGILRPEYGQITVLWEEVREHITKIDSGGGGNALAEVKDQAYRLSAALAGHLPGPGGLRTIQRQFNEFRIKANEVFNQTDSDLLSLLEQLKSVGEALRGVIKDMHHD